MRKISYTHSKLINIIKKRRFKKKKRVKFILTKTLIYYFISLIIELKNSNSKMQCLEHKEQFFDVKVLEFSNKSYLNRLKSYLMKTSMLKLKSKNNSLHFRLLLLLSGDVELNPGPSTYESTANKICSKAREIGLNVYFEYETPADGNCFYHSVIEGLTFNARDGALGYEGTHDDLRKDTVKYTMDHITSPFVKTG